MRLNPENISRRERLILSGLFLSKYDAAALKRLGFETFSEAFNCIGYALGARPMTVKNYRDEFDPLFRNPRKGWHKRSVRDYCRAVMAEYDSLPFDEFAGLITSFVGDDENAWSQIRTEGADDEKESTFAKRLVTGIAAERYFEAVQPTLSMFREYELEDTTRIGCGYDFRLKKPGDASFLAVEVKGLRERTGTISLTPREYDAATSYGERFFLFVAKNFQESPFHELYQNPVGGLPLVRKETIVVNTSWQCTV